MASPRDNMPEGGYHSITILQGATFYDVVQVGYLTDPDDEDSFVPIALDGLSGRSQGREHPNRDSIELIVFDVTVSQVTDTSDPACGLVEWRAGATVTGAVLKSGYYDLEIYDPLDSDIVYRPVQGSMTLNKEVTD